MLEYVTLIAAIVYLVIALYGYGLKKSVDYLSWIISSIGFLAVAGALVALGLVALEQPYAPYLGTIYPAFLAIGLLYRKEGVDWWKYYFYFTVIMFILMAIGHGANVRGLMIGAEVLLHVISGLIIVFLPIVEFFGGRWNVKYLVISLGGIVIGIGGMALASIVAGAPILPEKLVISLLHPILALSAFLIAIGIFLITEKS